MTKQLVHDTLTTANEALDQLVRNYAQKIAKSLKGKVERVWYAVGNSPYEGLCIEVSFFIAPKNTQIKHEFKQEKGESAKDFFERVCNAMG